MSEPHKQHVCGRIIFVDKDDSMRQMMELLLCDHFYVVTAGSAEEGLLLMEAEVPFHIAICGLTLLWMNGLEFLRRVEKSCPQTVRVLMSSGCGDMIDVHQAIADGGISRFVVKPFSVGVLLDQLKSDMASAIGME